MTDRNEMNEKNELNEQELEQAAGGMFITDISKFMTAKYRCPECGAKKKLAVRNDLVRCDKCKVQMEFIGYVDR